MFFFLFSNNVWVWVWFDVKDDHGCVRNVADIYQNDIVDAFGRRLHQKMYTSQTQGVDNSIGK